MNLRDRLHPRHGDAALQQCGTADPARLGWRVRKAEVSLTKVPGSSVQRSAHQLGQQQRQGLR